MSQKDDGPNREGEPDSEDASQDDSGTVEISLDRYLSRRRPRLKAGWLQIASMVGMLIMLVMIIVLKDRCAAGVAGTFNSVAPNYSQE